MKHQTKNNLHYNRKNKKISPHLTLIQRLKTEDWHWCIEGTQTNHKFGSKTYHAVGSSLQTHSLIISDWWSCIWVFLIGNMHLLKLVSILKLFNGLGSWVQRDLQLTSKIERIKRTLLKRSSIKEVTLGPQVKLALQETRLKLKV